jgi:predicted esterase
LEWAHLAEKHGFIVAAPALDSVQGILPVIGPLWREDLARDRQIILLLMDKLGREYNIDADSVLLTGFSAGGFPMYDTGLRDPDRFQLLVGRSCNSSIDLFEHIELTDEARQLPIFIFWGKDDPAYKMGWQAYEYLRMKGFRKMVKREIDGGHWRRPGVAYDAWVELWAVRHRSKAARLRPQE